MAALLLQAVRRAEARPLPTIPFTFAPVAAPGCCRPFGHTKMGTAFADSTTSITALSQTSTIILAELLPRTNIA